MLKKIKKYLNDKMILLPEGTELIRDFHDLEKWISSDSKMSIPGNVGNKKEITSEVTIKPFSLLQFPVTVDIYNFIINGVESELNNEIPIVNISWNEAIRFCNSLSLALELTPCYSFNDSMDLVTFDYQQMLSGNMLVEQDRKAIVMVNLKT